MQNTGAIKLFADAHVFDGKYQGSRTFLKEIYSQLAGKENLQLYLGAYDTDALKQHFPETKNIHFVSYSSRRAIKRWLFDIPSIIKKYGIHYAHFQYIAPPCKNCRSIVTTHDLLFKEFPKEFSFMYRLSRNFLFKQSARKAAILTTVSDYSKRSIQKYFNIPAPEIHLIPNGVSNLFFAAYDKEQAIQYIQQKFGVTKFILLVSRQESRKNHILLLQAFTELKLYEQGYQLVFIGWHENSNNAAYQRMMNSIPAHCSRAVLQLQQVDDADLLQFYRAAAVFVYPSKAEGFGIPPLEAAAVKTPVLCSNTSAMSDFTFFGAYHFDPANYTIFKTKLAVLLNTVPDTAILEQLAASIQQQYNWKRSADMLYQLIQTDRAQQH